MKKETFQSILGFLMIIAFLYGGYKLVVWVVSTIQPQVAATILTGAFTILLTSASILVSRSYESKSKIKEENRLKKIPIYNRFLEFMLGVLASEGDVSTKEVQGFSKEFNHNLLIWGSKDVVKKYGLWRTRLVRNANQPEETKEDPIEGLYEFEQLIIEIRKDLGHKDKNVERGDLLRVFLNDLDDRKKASE
ncbi:hypothetical protein SH601_02085 [Gracilibacillus sp. S3-1-1]|uniref:Uncharacterized protein n=1 Tax=Gracilibacillus pellucidus TaxID=3095368 RepID=A0ACC6M1G6_9BACI|nr:hypothetical protein [Gracilibacillus sp. S3-1-1]MDX8044763.1 hypothetical protein [Gracilibacillus sp. S3-1-1]